MTMLFGYANSHWFYIPSAFGYEYTCYESDTAFFEPGTAELMMESLVKNLNEMTGEK